MTGTQEKPPAFMRRSDIEPVVVGDYYDETKRYYDEASEHTVVKLYSGDYYISTQPREMLVTILGSCISACIRDPHARVGGMNHFLLPGESGLLSTDLASAGAATRYGVFAMEQLINGLLSRGALRDRLEIKLFGGGNVTDSSALIGEKNVAFVREFLRHEGLKIDSEHLGGTLPRRIHYYPDTGKVMMRALKRKDDLRIIEEEKRYAKQISSKPVEGDIELF